MSPFPFPDESNPPCHVDVDNGDSDARWAYWSWHVGSMPDHDPYFSRTVTHECGHWLGLFDEYRDWFYPWHDEPADARYSFMCWGQDVLQRHVQKIVDHADLSGHLPGGQYTVQ